MRIGGWPGGVNLGRWRIKKEPRSRRGESSMFLWGGDTSAILAGQSHLYVFSLSCLAMSDMNSIADETWIDIEVIVFLVAAAPIFGV